TFDASDDMALVTSVSKMFKDGAAVDAHANAQKTYDYYEDTFDRDSVDDNGQPLLSRVHVGDNWNNASWNGTYMSYGDGDGERFHSLAGALDVAAHEMTHGVIQHTSGLIYRNESGALNESIEDIFGVMFQRENGLMEKILSRTVHMRFVLLKILPLSLKVVHKNHILITIANYIQVTRIMAVFTLTAASTTKLHTSFLKAANITVYKERELAVKPQRTFITMLLTTT